MYTFGISFGYHDSSVALIKSNKILGVYSEERFSRKKHDFSFPQQSLEYVVNKYLIQPNQIDIACYYEDPISKLNRIYNQFETDQDFAQYLCNRIDKLELKNPLIEIANALQIPKSKVRYVDHHISHLFNSLTLFRPIKDDSYELVAFTLDGVGEYETASIYQIYSSHKKLNIQQISKSNYPQSLGLFYSAITAYLGFEVNDAEFKVMGLAAYGRPTYLKDLRKIISYSKQNGIYLDLEYFDFSPGALFPYKSKFIDLFGPPAPPSSSYVEEFTSKECVSNNQDLSKYADIACSAQYVINEIIESIFVNNSGNSSLPIIYSGGVALNSKVNYTLALKRRLLISPDPGDGGSSLGAASAAIFHETSTIPKFISPYLGYDINDDFIEESARKFHDIEYKDLSSIDELCASASAKLINADVIGWAQSKAEFGPRALGNRSILANPQNPEAQLFVNKAVKFREPFRPFAPAVLLESIELLFETSDIDYFMVNNPLNFMLVTLPVKPLAYELIPACIHVDGTSRVQIVTKDNNQLFHKLISTFYQQTGIPALLNTSFNLRGEPIVNNSYDAISTFLRSNMSSLYVGTYEIRKTQS